jgi:hypothetical protein
MYVEMKKYLACGRQNKKHQTKNIQSNEAYVSYH